MPGVSENLQLIIFNCQFSILPPSNNGAETPAGKPRAVNFDIGAIDFNIDIARPLNFYGIELLPKAIGYLKKVEDAVANAYNSTVIWISENGPTTDSGAMAKLLNRPAIASP